MVYYSMIINQGITMLARPTIKTPKAIKEHKCRCCKRNIKVGETYIYISTQTYNYPKIYYKYKYHTLCYLNNCFNKDK